jgi:hypothetical protein
MENKNNKNNVKYFSSHRWVCVLNTLVLKVIQDMYIKVVVVKKHEEEQAVARLHETE